MPAELVRDDGLELRGDTEAAEVLGEVDPSEAVIELLPSERELVRAIRMRLLDERADARADFLFAHFSICHGE